MSPSMNKNTAQGKQSQPKKHVPAIQAKPKYPPAQQQDIQVDQVP